MKFLSSTAIAALLGASSILGHPGEDHQQEIAERAAFFETSKRDLSHCAAKLKARGTAQQAIQRRAAIAKEERKKRGITHDAPFIKARDTDTVLATNHTSPVVYSPSTDEAIVFAGNNSCILSPEVTQGPYYVGGEYVRESNVEDQAGVELVLDTQVIDMATCDPVPNTMVEIWACNSTGVYSGIVAQGNGVGTDAPENINATFLRSLQPTDDAGVAKFTTLFPGHYTGRTTHIHIMAHFNGTSFENGTYNGGYVSHIGQIFFDQDLITQVEATSAYTPNTQVLTLNSEDSIFAQESATSDPVAEYSLLGSTVEEGIFAWLAFGIDLTSIQNVTGAATLTEGGGVANPNGGGGGPGGAPPNGTFPGGSPTGAPTGVPSSSELATSTLVSGGAQAKKRMVLY